MIRRATQSALIASLMGIALLSSLAGNVDEDEPSLCPGEMVAPIPGTLVICGGGETPDHVFDRFVAEAGGTAAHIVIITTASETADTEEVEEELDYWRTFPVASLTVLHTRSRDTANDQSFIEPLLNATGIWFIGGRQLALTETYLGTKTESEIHAVLKRGGVIGGESAGAAIMSSVMICSGRSKPVVSRGFGFLPGTVIDQHFLKRQRQGRLMRVLADHPGLVGLGIDEGTALIVQGSRMSVLGDSKVMACLSPNRARQAKMQLLDPGTEADIVSLGRVARSRKPSLAYAGTPGSLVPQTSAANSPTRESH